MTQSKPDALSHGFEPTAHGGVWRVWAPRAKRLELVLRTEEREQIIPFEPGERGWYSVSLDHVSPAARYLVRIDGARLRPDPASRWQPDDVHGPSAVFDPYEFRWNDAAWRGLPRGELVIYELHVGTFTEEGTFAAAALRLPQLKELGITCVEIMPVAQYPGKRGWGYDGVYPFAVQHSYGGPRALQEFVDTCHAHGFAVLLDVVYNHLGPEGNYLGEFGPYFTAKYSNSWGPAFNYDDSDSDAVRQYVLDNVRYWLRDFHCDGLRLDAVQTIFDTSPTHLLAAIGQVAAEESQRAGRAIHIIAESNMNDVRLLRSPAVGGYGLAGQWSDDFHHCVHTLLTGERQGYYADYGRPEHLVKALAQTFVYDGCYSGYHRKHYGAPSENLSGDQFVVSIQTHDQVGNRAHGERLAAMVEPPALRLAAALLLLAPHVPMLFMGEEYGETHPFPFFCSFLDEKLNAAVREGRFREYAGWGWAETMPDPGAPQTFDSARLSWRWPENSWQAGLRRWYRDLLSLRRELPALRDFTHRQATWHSAPITGETTRAQGILELVRGDAMAVAPVTAYFNCGSQRAPLGPLKTLRANDPSTLLLSSEGREYNGTRDGNASTTPLSDIVLLPYEVLVFGSPRHERPLP